MGTYRDGDAPRKSEHDLLAADLMAFLRRDFERHPEYRTFADQFAKMTSKERLARLTKVMQRPLGRTLADLLRDEPDVLERLALRSASTGARDDTPHEQLVAVLGVADSTKTQKRPLGEVLERLVGTVRNRARKARRATRLRGAKGLTYSDQPPEVPHTDREPLDEAHLARICAAARLDEGSEQRLFRAEVALLRDDPAIKGKPPMRAVAQLAGLTYGSARVIASRVNRKVRAARRAGRL